MLEQTMVYTFGLTLTVPIDDNVTQETLDAMRSAKEQRRLERHVLAQLRRLDGVCDIACLDVTEEAE